MITHTKVGLGLTLPLLVLVSYFAFFNCTEPTEVGIARNRISGEIWLQDTGGWHLTAPWVSVAVIDTRPVRVAVNSAGRGYNGKLVQFVPEAWREFVATEGFRYYWWANRISFNMGHDETYRGMRDMLRGYAYSSKKYPFIQILNEYETK